MDRRTMLKATFGAAMTAPLVAQADELPTFISGTSPNNALVFNASSGTLFGYPLTVASTGDLSGSVSKGTQSMRRYVRVIIVDPNESVPVDKAILYKGDEMLTDLTDQELYFSLPTPLSQTLEEHNRRRITFVNKARTDKEVMLEPARIRDIKMVVDVIAMF